ncbi:MAG: hypothetical protein IJT61_01710 [Bacteroidales bacterium]|nr:hypothetical protein [Bacteroidales bacterium]
MSVFDEILANRSVSVVGMAKNTGKTECLRYILAGCAVRGHVAGVTSIGIDGESLDQVTGTEKPEIVLDEGTLFVTAENFYRERRLTSEILDIGNTQTALGRLVVARAVTTGKAILAGPTATGQVRGVIRQLHDLGAKTVFVDGALSRKSLGSPAVTDAMVLATGAALSPNLPELVRKTRFVYDLLKLPAFESPLVSEMLEIESGIRAVTDDGRLVDLGISSAFLLEKNKSRLFEQGTTLFVSGAVGDNLFDFLRKQPPIADITLVLRDFTRIFASPVSVYSFLQKGGKIRMLMGARLLCICLNPWSPTGYVMDSEKACAALSEALGLPVYDIRKTPFQ